MVISILCETTKDGDRHQRVLAFLTLAELGEHAYPARESMESIIKEKDNLVEQNCARAVLISIGANKDQNIEELLHCLETLPSTLNNVVLSDILRYGV